MNKKKRTYQEQDTDLLLINEILNGNSKSLNNFLVRHQDFIYNVALKMSANIPDAQDATQEVLLKIVSNLSKYNAEKGNIRAWIYRLAFNHILNMKDNPYEKNKVTFSKFFDFLENIKDHSYSKSEELIMGQTFEEAKINCTTGMLMCLNRDERLTFIIGDLFRIDSNLAAEIFKISPSSFRKKLSRSRQNLRQWMTNKCGLVDKANPCRCKKKTKGFIEKGWVNPTEMRWTSDFKKKISETVSNEIDPITDAYEHIISNIYAQHPYKTDLNGSQVFNEIFKNEHFKKIIK